MRYVSYLQAGEARPGLLTETTITPIRTMSLLEFIALPPSARTAHITSERIALESVSLAAPVIPRRNIFCVGRNYLEHAKERARALGREVKLPDLPAFFTKAPGAIAAPGAQLHLQARLSSEYDFEAELAVVIGTRCKDVAEDKAMDTIFGYTCLNDVTARDLQRAHLQWFKGKSLDDCAPLGPWIVTPEEFGDPQARAIAFRLNGIEKQSSTTAQMLFPIRRLIAELSKGMTLLPGDIIATGTPEGVGFARTPPEFLRDGDTMEVEIDGIGILRNTVRIS